MDSYTRDLTMSKKERRSRSGKSGVSTRSTRSDQRPKCFRDIMDLVLHLSDDEWTSVSRGMRKGMSRVKFAAVCSKIVTEVSSAVVRRLLKPLIRSFGIKVVQEANEQLNKMESELGECSASGAPDPRTQMEASEFICHLAQRVVTEFKGAMLVAIRSMASEPVASSPAEVPIMKLDELSRACTDEICDKILGLYHAEEVNTLSEDKLTALLKVHKIMSGLEEVVSVSRSSSWISVTSDLVSTEKDVMSPDSVPTPSQAESPFSEQFLSTAKKLITEVLLQTEQASMSSQSSVSTPSQKKMKRLAKTRATEILHRLYYLLYSCMDADQSIPEHVKVHYYAQQIHKDIHKQVLTFLSEHHQATSDKSRTLTDVGTEIDSELDQKSVSAIEALDKATQVTSEILESRLSSQISSGSISRTSLVVSTGVFPDFVTSGSISSDVFPKTGISDVENRLESLKERSSDVSRKNLPSHSRVSEGVIIEESYPQPSDQNRLYTPLHIFTVIRDQLRSIFKSSKSAAADEKNIDPSAHSESVEDCVDPVHVSRDSSVHQLDFGRTLSDSVLDKRETMVLSMQLPPKLIHTFVDLSTKALMENVLKVGSSEESEESSSHTAEVQHNKKRPRVRYIVKRERCLVVRRPKKQKRRRRVSRPQTDQPSIPPSTNVSTNLPPNLPPNLPTNLSTNLSTNLPTNLPDTSEKRPKTFRSVLKSARKALGRFFSKTFTSCINTKTTQ